ncbi:hypothetical protein PR048_006647 [Dryococelus australis]|uniref:Uncharacterized protein n=1 Tax=Dryococelus australis TaxID=614101 RepID=A0ABQ9IC65_9NEOP|nr:hypothetical protein PR048_006647 [Dryococelus australis]
MRAPSFGVALASSGPALPPHAQVTRELLADSATGGLLLSQDLAGLNPLTPSTIHQGEPSSIPGRVTPGFSQVGIVPDNAAGRRIYRRSSASPALEFRLLHSHCISSSSALETSLRAAQISQLSVSQVRVKLPTPPNLLATSPLTSSLPTKLAGLTNFSQHLKPKFKVVLKWLEKSSTKPFCINCKIISISLGNRGRGGVVVRQLASQQDELGSIPDRVTSGFSQVGIMPDDATGRQVFSRISCFPRPFIPALLHTHLTTPSSLHAPRNQWQRKRNRSASTTERAESTTRHSSFVCALFCDPRAAGTIRGGRVYPRRRRLVDRSRSAEEYPESRPCSSASEKLDVSVLICTHLILPRCRLTRYQAVHVARALSLNKCEPSSIPSEVAGFSYEKVGRQVYSGIARFLRPCILAFLHVHLASPSSAIETSEISRFPTIEIA